MKEVNYYFGNGKYKDVLTCLATTKVNSFKTSSLPLAQFWRPETKNKELDRFITKCKNEGLDISSGNRFFEYPTPCIDEDGKELKWSKPSMTDLMIINDNGQKIAIECKYTEYSESNYQSIKDWNNNEDHKTAIQNQWFKYIKDNGYSDKQNLDDSIPYQFLHRTASACFDCKDKKPVLVYQLFYDRGNEQKKNDFKQDLQNWAKKLGLNNRIDFFVIEIEITNIEDVEKKYNGIRSDLFLIMRETEEPIYLFDWDHIKISNFSKI